MPTLFSTQTRDISREEGMGLRLLRRQDGVVFPWSDILSKRDDMVEMSDKESAEFVADNRRKAGLDVVQSQGTSKSKKKAEEDFLAGALRGS
jgi:hypothetical protein